MAKVQLKGHPLDCFVMVIFAFDFDLAFKQNHSLPQTPISAPLLKAEFPNVKNYLRKW